MLVINQRYGRLSWIDAYPMYLYEVLLGSESDMRLSSRAIQLGSIATSKPGWRNHKSCNHVQVSAEVDFDLPTGPDETTGLYYVDSHYVVDEGEFRRVQHIQNPSPDYNFAGDLDYAVHGQVMTLNDGQKLICELRIRHRQFIRNKVFWYPEYLLVGYLYTQGNGSIYDYKRTLSTLKSWSHTRPSDRKNRLEDIPEWSMSIDELLTTYGAGTFDEYALLWSDQKYADIAHSMTYVGHHSTLTQKFYEQQYRSIPLSDDYIRRYMEKWVYPYFGDYPIPSISDWGDLCYNAIQSCNLDANAWTLQSDLSEFGSEIAAYARAIKKPSLKNISGAYLNTKYGTRLTVEDIKSYGTRLESLISDYSHVYQGYDIHAARRNIDELHSNGWSGFDSITCYTSIKDSMLDIVVHSLQETGIGKLSNAWDIIPFTFVVDWFLDVGNVFEQLDYRWNASTLSVRDVIRTYKRMKSVPIDNFLGSGKRVTVTMTVYSRSCGNKLSFPSLGIAPSGVYQNHVLDLSMIGLHLLG